MSQNNLRVILLLILNILFSSSELRAFDYVINDFKPYTVPSIPKPVKGVEFKEPIFGNRIVRITDSKTELAATAPYAHPGYPKHNIENADGSMLIIQSRFGSTWQIYNANPPYNKIKEIPSSLIGWGSAIDARWDNAVPEILYYQYGGQMWKFKVSTATATSIYDFRKDFPPVGTKSYGQTMLEEGDASDDRRYWAFILYGSDPTMAKWGSEGLFVFDKDYYGKDNGKIISIIKKGHPNYADQSAGFAGMSPSGKYVWTGDALRVYTRDLTAYKDAPMCCHAAMAISQEGREVIFGFKVKDDVWSLGYWACMWDIETGKLTYLTPIGDPRYHFSGNAHDKPGWGVISTYGTGATPLWNDLEIDLIELTTRKDPPPRIWRIAQTREPKGGGYKDAPFAKWNKKGTKIWFGSGWGQLYNDIGFQYDIYQVNLPSTWYQDLMGKLPPNTDKTPPAIPKGFKVLK